jgi:hydroxyethylthiazole kinase-like uncharacterized protein yjeF
MKILTAAQMGEVDRLSTEIYQIPSLLLMENAGRAVVDALARSVDGLQRKRILVCCGKGNNGGDGLVVARHLLMRGAKPVVYLFGDPSGLKGDCLTNWKIVSTLGLETQICPDLSKARSWLDRQPLPDVIVDGLFGTGLSKPLGADFQSIVEWINKVASKAFVVAVDLPSGISADSCEIPGVAVRAHLTVTFTALKMALVMPPAADCAGRLEVASIGSPEILLLKPEYPWQLIDARLARHVVPPRSRDSHKGNHGHVFVLAGSPGKSGAALMAGMGALRAGAGLVTLGLPRGLQSDVVGRFPELMTEFFPDTAEGTTDSSAAETVLKRALEVHSLVVGPGMTTNESTQRLIREVVRRSPIPVVIDADGLNACAADTRNLHNDNKQVVVVTPHPGEMSRLTGLSIGQIQKARREIAAGFSRDHGCITVLKGSQTVVATPAGEVFINSTGNPGMATGGTGDILAGMIGRFVACWYRKHCEGEVANVAEYVAGAVYLHGLAGDLAARGLGMESLVATDLLPCLPEAFKQTLAESSVFRGPGQEHYS